MLSQLTVHFRPQMKRLLQVYLLNKADLVGYPYSQELFVSLQRYILYLLTDVANELGWVEAPGDPHLKR